MSTTQLQIDVRNGAFELHRCGPTGALIRKVKRLSDGREFSLGLRVYSNGRYGPENGRMGLIVAIHTPYEKGRTDDILDVWFEGETIPMQMKMKDLI